MIEGQEAIRLLEGAGARLFVGVPDSLMKGFCSALGDHRGPGRHVVAANEGGAVATAAGHYLATGRPAVVYMQNSGLGNAASPLVSLASRRVYGIPMLLIIGWRGEPGTVDEPQHDHQGDITTQQLELLEISISVAEPDDDGSVFVAAYERALSGQVPVAVLVRKGVFVPPPEIAPGGGLTRMSAMEMLLQQLPTDTAYVATTGYTGRELALLRAKREESWSSDLLMVGSMGHAAAIALGIAVGTPGRLVCCFDGDGAVVMHMGTLAAVGAEQPANLLHVVMNNGVHESVGGQPSALRDADIPALARSLGYVSAEVATDKDELASAVDRLHTDSGPNLIEVRISSGTVDGLPRPSSLRERVVDMRDWLSG
ncbi:MAG: phosphonopyruvate decarboxylase [Actinomycetota bacterium]